MTDHHILLWTLIVQVAGVAGLAIYCLETWKIRKASQKQVEASQSLIGAALDQVEGLSRPCLTFATTLRDEKEAIMGLGVVGSTIARGISGDFVFHNIGNGPAFNINYQFVAVGEYARNFPTNHIRYVLSLTPGEEAKMIEGMNVYNGQFEVIFQYESIGGRRYESKIAMTAFVLTGFNFKELKSEETTGQIEDDKL